MNPIFANILITVAFIVPWVAFSAENIPYFKQIGPTRALTVNFNQGVDKDTLIELKKALPTERKKAKNSAPRQKELTFIDAMIAYAEGQYGIALKTFDTFEAHDPLFETATYYAGVIRRKNGTLADCNEARKRFAELMGKDSMLQAQFKREFNEASLCVAKNLLQSGQKAEAKQFIPTLVSNWIEMSSANAEYLYKALLDLYLEDQQPDLAKSTLKDAKKSLSDPSWITLYEMQHPELKDGGSSVRKLSPAPRTTRKSRENKRRPNFFRW